MVGRTAYLLLGPRTQMRSHARLIELHCGSGSTSPDPPMSEVHLTILRECFELFHFLSTGLARLSIETSSDLFEFDSRVTIEEVYEFKSKRAQWTKAFDAGLRDLFEKRLAGTRRSGRRPDALQTIDSLRVMSDIDTSKQSALERLAKRLEAAAQPELDALDWRVSTLFGETPGRDVDSPFAPAYLLDAIGMTSRSLYVEPRIWKTLMERVVSDFIPAINKTYVQLNRLLAQRRILPEIGAMLRARSELRPTDDGRLLPLFSRLLNEIHPYFQAWRTLDPTAAAAASYRLAPLSANPYATTAASVPPQPQKAAGAFPQLNAMMVSGALSAVLEALDHWQRTDPMDEYLRLNAPAGFDASVMPVNRIPWIHAAIASQITEAGNRDIIDVVGFLFDYIFHDPSIPPRFRMIFGKVQLPILKAALLDPGVITDKKNSARRFLEDLAVAAIGAEDDEAYGAAFDQVASSIVAAIRDDFVLDPDVFAYACERLEMFTGEWQQKMSRATQPQLDAGLAAEMRDADRSRVRVLIRDRLSGIDVPFDIRVFLGTVWTDYLTGLRQAEGTCSDAYVAAVQIMDDMLWSITAKRRTGQKARLATMIPPIVMGLRAGGATVQVPDEKMKCFLNVLYDLHMMAMKPMDLKAVLAREPDASSLRSPAARKRIENLHDFVADLVLGTWLSFEQGATIVKARLSWISPWRATYIFANRSGSAVMTFSPEELAWEMSTGRAALILEPVPLFDRALSVALDYLAERKAKQDAGGHGSAARLPSPSAETSVTAIA